MEQKTPEGDRIAKVLARAGVASRREVERMIEAGRVSVNGKVIASPALNVTAKDRIAVDGMAVGEPEPPRIWLFHKPPGLVTTEKDERGRQTVFDALPKDMPRVMSIGRLDINSEGLLLLTNDGGVKRRLELPSTGWVRKYRVRVKGTPEDAMLEPLRKGITVEGQRFQPMSVTIDRQQGANAWLTIAIKRRQEPRDPARDGACRAGGEPADPGELRAVHVARVARRAGRRGQAAGGARPAGAVDRGPCGSEEKAGAQAAVSGLCVCRAVLLGGRFCASFRGAVPPAGIFSDKRWGQSEGWPLGVVAVSVRMNSNLGRVRWPNF